jgi:hypothetical protein
MAETTYVILKLNRATGPTGTAGSSGGQQGGWAEIGEQVAGSPETAVRAFMNIEGNGDKYGEGEYRGVAKRSWGDVVPIQKKISFA